MTVCIVRLSAMGDIIHSMIALEIIKRSYPLAQIDWVCEEAFEPLLRHSALIRDIHRVQIKRAKKERSFTLLKSSFKMLSSLGPYDVVIDMQGLLKSAIVARAISDRVHGFSFKSAREGVASLLYRSTTKICYSANSIVRNATLVSDAIGVQTDISFLNDTQHFIHAKSDDVPFDFDYTCLVIGSTWPSRNYPSERWIELLKAVPEKKFVILWGNSEEHSVAQAIQNASSNAIVAPKTTLDELITLVGRSTLLLGNDTGPTHLAWAMGIPSVTLFGPTPVSRIFETPINIALKSSSLVDPLKLNKNDFSIKEIPISSIITAIEKVTHA